MPMRLMPKGSWSGSESGLRDLIDLALMARRATETQGLMGLTYDEDEEEEQNRLLSIVDSIGVINISGSLVNSDSYWNRFFGVTGYPEIRDAVIEAANDESVKEILLNIDSGGGVVKGVFSLAEFIKEVDASIKPVKTFNSGMMASAAYLLGSQGREVFAGEMTQTGSIGVIMIHMEYTEALKKEGVKVNIIRAGEYKALVNPYEKLTDDARLELQAEADYIHGKFIEVVATGRELSYTSVKENMADGKVFYSEEALRLGLVDDITSIDQLVSELNSDYTSDGGYRAHTGDSVDSSLETSSAGDTDMAKKNVKLSAENQAKIASGVPLKDLETSAEDGVNDPKADKTVTEGDEVTEAKADEATDTTDAELENDDSTDAEADDKSTGSTEIVAFLKEQNKELNTQLSERTLELSKSEAKLSELESSTAGLETIVVSTCNRLSIGMGQSNPDHSALTGNSLVAQHNKLDTEFCKLFPIGGIASTDAEPAEDKNITQIHGNRSQVVKSAEI